MSRAHMDGLVPQRSQRQEGSTGDIVVMQAVKRLDSPIPQKQPSSSSFSSCPESAPPDHYHQPLQHHSSEFRFAQRVSNTLGLVGLLVNNAARYRGCLTVKALPCISDNLSAISSASSTCATRAG